MRHIGCWTLWLFSFALVAQTTTHIERGIFRGDIVEYEVVDGRAMFQGDIDLGPAAALETFPEPAGMFTPRSVTTVAASTRWPNGVVPYVIDPDIPVPQRVLDAIGNWNRSAPVKIIPRTTETDYVHVIRFPSNGRCSSAIGRAGGEQFLRVDDGCQANGLTHEFGHALGLYHEQSRADRNYYVTVDLSNTDKRYLGDHSIQLSGIDRGGYDFGSIMHYNRYGEAKAPQLPIYETIPAGMPIDGSGHGLSAGDIDAVTRIYGSPPALTTVTSNPEGLQVRVDGQVIITPMAFSWSAGSSHSLDVPNSQGDNSLARYQFGRWNDNGGQSHTISATPELTVYSASFIRQYKVNSGISPNNSGTVTLSPSSPDGYYTEGTLVTATESPASGFTFAGWNGTGANFFVLIDAFSAPTATFRVTIPNLAYVAHYTQNPIVTITTDPPGIPITVNGSLGAAPRAIGGSPGGNITLAANPIVPVGVGSSQYVFISWSDGGAATHTATLANSAPYGTLTATYRHQYLVTTAVSGQGTVTVSPASATGYYDDGTQIEVTAIPANGYQFTGWSRDLSGASLVQTMTVSDQTYVLATFQRPFVLTAAGIVNAASYIGGGVSPGEIISIFGWQIGPPNLTTLQIDANGKVSTTLAGTRVLFDGVAAPLVYVTPNVISAIVPYAVAARTTTSIQVSLTGQTTPALAVPVVAAVPGLFTVNSSGQGPAAILNEDFTLNSSSNPAPRGSTVVLYATGEGATNPDGVDGKLAAAPYPAPRLQPVTVLLGGPKGVGVSAPVRYAGSAPTLVSGVFQVNIQIPLDAPVGNVPVAVSLGSIGSLEMTSVAIQ